MKIVNWIFKRKYWLLALFVIYKLTFVWLPRPLFPTTRWQVEASTHDGKPLRLETYKMLGRDVLFMRVEGGAEAPLYAEHPRFDFSGMYVRWFAIDFANFKRKYGRAEDNVHVAQWVHMNPSLPLAPYLAHYPNEPYGRDILGGTLDGETWFLHYTQTSVIFSNEAFSVSVFQTNTPHPPASAYKKPVYGVFHMGTTDYDGQIINAGLNNVNKGFHALGVGSIFRRYTP